MADCKLLAGCAFFNKAIGPLAEMMRVKYCQGDFENCARYMIATKLGREKVPQSLFPNMQEKAKQILAG